MYPCVCYPSTRVSENEFGSFNKTKNLTCNNCSNLLRQLQQDFQTKFAQQIEWSTF